MSHIETESQVQTGPIPFHRNGAQQYVASPSRSMPLNTNGVSGITRRIEYGLKGPIELASGLVE